MTAERYLLDTSALLTLIEDEEGADRVEDVLRNAKVWLVWPSLLEVYYVTQRVQGEGEADRRYAWLRELPATLIWEVSEPVLLTAARLKATHRLSFVDALIAAYAIQVQATLLHKDPEFESLAGEVDLESLPFKIQSKN